MSIMKTTIYFVRHAESIYIEGKERSRGLTDSGKIEAMTVRDLLIGEGIDYFSSSPYERSIETIRPTANEYLQDIQIEEDLRERNIGEYSPITFSEAKRLVYEDIQFAFPYGESSLEAQRRAVEVVKQKLETYEGKKIVIGTHGDIMTLIMGYFDKRYGFEFWQSTSMPDIYKLVFEGKKLLGSTRMWRSTLEEGTASRAQKGSTSYE